MRPDIHGLHQLRSEIMRAGDLPIGELRARWKELLKQSPPKALKGNFLSRAFAHALQEKVHGQLLPLAIRNRLQAALQDKKPKATRAVNKINVVHTPPMETDGDEAPIKARTNRQLSAGTRLIREWQGKQQEVIVLPDGFLWQGKVHASLSLIAREMTGTRWNGWIFFGLKRRVPKLALPSAKTSSTTDKSESISDLSVMADSVGQSDPQRR